ncbi:MAG: peptidylprolyl isomerase [Alicyclobacillaceae bacterium]|nr:peptidylprolyl isomerase [Alicyclobacillaceae bacterium]
MHKRRHWNRWLAGGSAVLAFALAGCSQSPNSEANTTAPAQQPSASLPKEPVYSGPVVATYRGGTLTKGELDKQYNLMLLMAGLGTKPPTKRQFLETYVVYYKYLYGKAVKETKAALDTNSVQQIYDEEMSQLASQYNGKQGLQKKMKALGVSADDLRLYIEKYQYLVQYMQEQMKNVQVSDAQAEAYYNKHKSDYIQVTVDQILVNSESQAKQIEAKLKAGGNFAKLADQYSQDPTVQNNHGHMADTLVSDFVAPFANACRTLPIGQISDPVHTQYGYHILRVDSRKQLSFKQAADDVKQKLQYQAEQAKQAQILTSAKKEADVKVIVKDAEL